MLKWSPEQNEERFCLRVGLTSKMGECSRDCAMEGPLGDGWGQERAEAVTSGLEGLFKQWDGRGRHVAEVRETARKEGTGDGAAVSVVQAYPVCSDSLPSLQTLTCSRVETKILVVGAYACISWHSNNWKITWGVLSLALTLPAFQWTLHFRIPLICYKIIQSPGKSWKHLLVLICGNENTVICVKSVA